MAKFGEGDDRWLVKDLGEGGRNVNAWHWVEKDALPWAKARLGELLVGKTLVEGGGLAARVTKLKSATGDCIVNNRKQKVIAAYELDVRLGWEGTDAEGATVTGELVLPYISEENHDEDPELQVLQAATSGSSPAAERLRQAIYAQGRPLINAAVQEFVGELRAGGPMRPQAAGAAATGSSAVAVGGAPPAGKPAAAPPAQEAAPKADQLQQPAPAPAAAQAAAGDSSSGSISLSSKFYASARDLYECFTDPRRMMAYTRAPVEAQPQLGGRLSMYGGSIEGTYVELVPEEQVVLDWRFKEWQAGVFSKVVISITEKTKGSTSVKIEQSGIPETDRFGHHDCTGNAKEGWERLLRQIKVVFGYGV